MSDRSTESSGTIFVVDDDASVRTALERLLRAAGWTVRTFASAEELLHQDVDLGIGCLVADVHLGRMTGLELKTALNSRAAKVPVILTSGVDDAALEGKAHRVGAIAFFRKPFDVGALLDSIKESIERRPPTCDEAGQ
jgi:FixJ family two-component response regulator